MLSSFNEWLVYESRRTKLLWCNKVPAGYQKEYLQLLQEATDVRLQLNEQLRCLDGRMDTQVCLVQELQEYFRRRSEVEMEYSKNLDKLAKNLLLRHKEQKQRREQWPMFSSFTCWQHLISQTRRASKDHAVLSEIYATNMVNRFQNIIDDVQRIYRRCREIGYESHEELLKVLHELHTALKTYHTYHAELRQTDNKLGLVEQQRKKLENSIPKEKLDKSKKYRVIEKEVQKRKNKYNDAKLKALRARNDYILCMDAANAAIHKYFVDDISDLMDCMDFGFHNSVARAVMCQVSAEENLRRSLQTDIEELQKCVNSLDSRLDKQRFLEANNSAFMIPKKFEFQGKGDDVAEVVAQKIVQEELETRYKQLHKRLMTLKTESEEIWKTLETAEKSLMEMINTKDYDCSIMFGEEIATQPKTPEALSMKLRSDRQETEDFYLSKFREYIIGSNLITRLQSKHEIIRKALGEEAHVVQSPKVTKSEENLPCAGKPRRKRIGRVPMVGQPKLFGGSLEEYLEATNQEIPLIMKSCIRVINLYGLHHQGIFRVSGAQVEINNFREAFERDEDPLADVTDASDINSVAGVFKLYLRELREPLFPIFYFDQFMDLAQLESKPDFVNKVRDVVKGLPRTVFVVMRYLFAFLNHLSEFSDENMMDPYNLAICFGPTLVPIPDDKDQVQYQNLVNELIKNIIIYAEDIFPNDGGILYEKYISRDLPDETDVGESPPDHGQDDLDSEVCPSEDDSVFKDKDTDISLQIFEKSEALEAVAQYDFLARSDREVSFKKGDNITLYSQVSGDWWRGSIDGKEGLIPDKYILLKIRDDDRDKFETKSSSEESVRRRSSSSSDAAFTGGNLTRKSYSHHSVAIVKDISPESVEPSNVCTSSDHVSGADEKKGCTVDTQSVDSISLEESTRSVSPLDKTSSTFGKEDTTKVCESSTCSLNVTLSDAALRTSQESINSLHSVASLPYSPSHTVTTADPSTEPQSDEGKLRELESTLVEVLTVTKEMEQQVGAKDGENITHSTEKNDAGTEKTSEKTDEKQDGMSASFIDVALRGKDGEDGDAVVRRLTWESRSVVGVETLEQVEKEFQENFTGFNRNREMWEKRASSQTNLLQMDNKEGKDRNNRAFWEQRTKMIKKTTPDLVMDLPLGPLSTSPKEKNGMDIKKERRNSTESPDSNSSSSSTSPASSPGMESPDMTAAERFAKHQCTLKKNSRVPPHGRTQCSGGQSTAIDAQTQTAVTEKKTTSTIADLAPRDSNDISDLRTQDQENDKASQCVRQSTGSRTPKLAAKFEHLATAQQNTSFKPQIRVKPQILRKPVLSLGSSTENHRRDHSPDLKNNQN